jgi:hypothetical protein
MALIDSEGFGFSTNWNDYVTYGRFIPVSGELAPAMSIVTGGPLGDNYMTFNAGFDSSIGGRLARAPLANSPSQAFVGFRLNFQFASPAGLGVMFVDSANVALCTVVFNAVNGVITAEQGGWGTALSPASAGGAMLVAGWAYVEIGVTVGTTTGAITVRINGETVLSLTGVNTQNGGVAGITSVEFVASGNSGYIAAIAHLYICDATGAAPWNTFLGDVRVQTLLPTSNDVVAFTPNGLANNWQNAASVPPVPGTDFNSDATVGAQDTFNCGTLAAGLGTIFGLNVKTLLSKTDAGLRTAAGVVKSGPATQVATAVSVGTSPEVASGIFTIDPNTGVAWTTAGVNAAKVGYKIVA